MAQNKVLSLDKSGSASKTETEHTEKLDSKKRSVPSLVNKGLLLKLKHNGQRNKILKKDPNNYPVQIIKNWQNRTQKI